MADLTYQLVTGLWSYIVADGTRRPDDADADPDEVFPSGIVTFTPNIGGNVALPAGSPTRDAAVGVITGIVADGVLQDLQGRTGIRLATRVGTRPVFWTAVPTLKFADDAIAAREVTFGPTTDVTATIHLNDQLTPGTYPPIADQVMQDLLADVADLRARTSQPFHYQRSTAAATWTIAHNLNRYPAGVSIILPSGEVVEADVVHTSTNQTVITFPAPTSGRAELI